jgi:hypothetical protein
MGGMGVTSAFNSASASAITSVVTAASQGTNGNTINVYFGSSGGSSRHAANPHCTVPTYGYPPPATGTTSYGSYGNPNYANYNNPHVTQNSNACLPTRPGWGFDALGNSYQLNVPYNPMSQSLLPQVGVTFQSQHAMNTYLSAQQGMGNMNPVRSGDYFAYQGGMFYYNGTDVSRVG